MISALLIFAGLVVLFLNALIYTFFRPLLFMGADSSTIRWMNWAHRLLVLIAVVLIGTGIWKIFR